MTVFNRIRPDRIATQITLLVVASAIIFHLCMSGTFLLMHYGHKRPLAINILAQAINLIDATDVPARPAILAAIAKTDPDLDIRADTNDAHLPETDSPEPLIAGLMPKLRTHIQVAAQPHGSGALAGLLVRLSDGSRLRSAAPFPQWAGPDPSMLIYATMFFLALSTTLFVLWAVRSVIKPLGEFAEAVDAFALHQNARSLAETGPIEIATVSRAFNRMQSRITGMIHDRTQMLASVSHDLRTPITRLRLRVEFVEDAKLREWMLRDLRQMDALVHNALSFIRDGAAAKPPVPLDLASLLRTVCDEASDMGQEVTYRGPDHLVIRGHSDELQRAVSNLVENAAHVDAMATVDLIGPSQGVVDIVVSDDGPGIPAEALNDMLKPFRRGQEPNGAERATGFGLGLPIVKAIAAAHGGTFTLANREPHGLCCRITLPVG